MTSIEHVKTMAVVVKDALTKAGLPPDFIDEDLMVRVVMLMESSYNQGYEDGKEDAQTKHKMHVMSVLREQMEGK